MICKFKEENIIYKGLTLAVLAGMIYFVARVIVNVILGINYPNELLEPSNVALTRMFLEGKCPYVLNSLNYEIPAVNYEYPFLGSLLSALVALCIGGNAVLAHYIVSFAAFIGTGILGYFILTPYSKTTVAPVAGAFLFLLCHWRFGFISAAPDDLGLFLFVLTLFLAVNEKVKNKPLICAILTTLCFYTKQYFLFVFVGIFVYMLLYSKKEAVKFLVETFAVNLLVGIVVTIVWPLYWSYTFFFLYFGCATGTGFGFANLIGQMKYLLAIFVLLFFVIAVAFVMLLRKYRKEGKKITSYEFKENDPLVLFIVEIPVMFLPLILFGRNDGAFLSYFLQLWMPSIIVVTFIILEKMEASEDKKVLFDTFYGLVVVFTVLFAYLKLPLHVITQDEINNWEKAYKIVNDSREKGDVLYSQQLAYLAFENGDKYYFCGHDGEVSMETLEVWNNSGIARNLFPYVDDIINKNMDFRIAIIVKAFESEFEMISFQDGNSLLFSEEFVDAGHFYTKMDKIPLQEGNMPYEVTFYEVVKYD